MKTYNVTDLQLEQFLLNELPEEMMIKIDSLIKEDSLLKKRIEDLRKSNSEIIEKYPAKIIAQQINDGIISEKQRIADKKAGNDIYAADERKGLSGIFADFYRRASKRVVYSFAAAATSAVVAAIIILSPAGIIDNGTVIPENDIIRIKGMEPGISVFRKTAAGTEELKNLAKTAQGDLLQISYTATGEYKHGVILSIDGRGTVTLHYPDSETGSTLIKLNNKVMLARSYELDDSPSFEKFILILSIDPPDVKSIIAKAKILAQNREDVLNGRIMTGEKNSEFSLTVKK